MKNEEINLVGQVCVNKDGMVLQLGISVKLDYSFIMNAFKSRKDKDLDKKQFCEFVMKRQLDKIMGIVSHIKGTYVKVYLEEKDIDDESREDTPNGN